jgi:hypothetical protein
MNWKEACDQVGFAPKFNPPSPEKVYYAYKNGIAREFSDKADAVAFSELVEHITINDAAIKEWNKSYIAAQHAAIDLYLTTNYSDIDPQICLWCYEEAYDRGHSSGYEEVFLIMSEIVEFAKRIIKFTEERNN